MTAKQATRYAELERMEAERVPIADQAKKLGVSIGRIYAMRTDARIAGFVVRERFAGGEGALRRIDAEMAIVCPNPRCATRGIHVCVGRASDYLQRREEPSYATGPLYVRW